MPLTEVQIYLGKYDRVLVNTLRRTPYRLHESKHVCNFLSAFPEKKRLTEFSCIDLNDYLLMVRKNGYSEGRCKAIRASIARFWRYLLSAYPVPLPNISSCPHLRRMGLSAMQANEILQSAGKQPDFYQWLLQFLLLNENGEMTYAVALRRWRKLVRSLGLPKLTMKKFRSVLRHRVWGRDLLNKYYQLGDASLPKAKMNSKSLANIQLPPLDIRPPISNSCECVSTV